MKKIKDFFSKHTTTVLSIAAVIISFYSIYYSNELHRDSQTSSVIRDNYSDFFNLHEIRASYPLQSHLFVSAKDYPETKNNVIQAVEGDSTKERITNLLIEGALARRIFSMYEHSFYQWKNAELYSDNSRARFLKEVLNYFTNTLLKNPRLKWYWSGKGKNLKTHYELEVIKYYDENVTTDIKTLTDFDSVGVFDIPKLPSEVVAIK